MKAADQMGVGDNARFLKNALAAGVKQLLPSRRETAVTRAVSALMDNRGGPEDENFAYLDPKLPPGDPGSSRSRSHTFMRMTLAQLDPISSFTCSIRSFSDSGIWAYNS